MMGFAAAVSKFVMAGFVVEVREAKRGTCTTARACDAEFVRSGNGRSRDV